MSRNRRKSSLACAAVASLVIGPAVAIAQPAGNLTDLTPREGSALPRDAGESRQADEHVLSNPWWMNFNISGFVAAGYYDTGSDATRAIGTFEIKEASLFVSASVWEDADIFLELQTNRLGKDDQLFARTGEVYVHLRNIGAGMRNPIGLKVGRIDIPFGEEYLWQDAIDNPLITNSASYPYGWDEGVLAYGDLNRVSWVAALMDGTDQRSQEDNADKALAIKLYSDVTDALYLSASMMTNGEAAKSAIEFGGSHFEPIGASHVSTLPSSPSAQVDANLFQIDVKYDLLNSNDSKRAYIAFALGTAKQKDSFSQFDRTLRWFSIEPYVNFNEEWYVALRYGEIGTYDGNEGFHFDGKTFAGGNGTFGYDVERFRRIGLALGWTPNANLSLKIEIGDDSFDLIDGSPLADGGDRAFIGFEVAAGF